jgi:hypothetical protein
MGELKVDSGELIVGVQAVMGSCFYCGLSIPGAYDNSRVSHVECMNKEWAERYRFKVGQYVSLGIRINGGYCSIDGYIVKHGTWGVIVKDKKTGKEYETNHCGNVLPYVDQSHLEPKQLTINFK